jgi:cobalt-zinc-cadmium efflux system outer membrane protein
MKESNHMGIRYPLLLWLYLFCFFPVINPSVSGNEEKTVKETVVMSFKDKRLTACHQNRAAGLTLEKALSAALDKNPDLKAAEINTRVGEAALLQAGLFPNPEIEFEYENFDEPETTLTVGYLLELGKKRKYRRDVAVAEKDLLLAETEGTRSDIICRTAAAFINVLMAQENRYIALEKEKLADQVFETAGQRVMAGHVSPMEAITAEINKNKARLEVEKAENENLIFRTLLSAMWDGSADDFGQAVGAFDRIQPLPALEALTEAIDNSPVIRAKRSEISIAANNLTLENRSRIPDLSLSGGMKESDEMDDTIYIVGISMPVPLFDRNQGGVARASAELRQQQAELKAEKKRLLTEVQTAFQRLKTVHAQVHTMKTSILPSAEKVLDAVKEGYREGEFSLLDMLAAQGTLYETRESHIASLGQYHHTIIDLERLLGRDLLRLNQD